MQLNPQVPAVTCKQLLHLGVVHPFFKTTSPHNQELIKDNYLTSLASLHIN